MKARNFERCDAVRMQYALLYYTVREKTYRNATHYLGNPFLIGFYLYH